MFSDPMAQAVHEGRKTVTRRLVKPQPWAHITGKMPEEAAAELLRLAILKLLDKPPYKPGEIVYVKEAWVEVPDAIMFRGDPMFRDMKTEDFGFKWNPPLFLSEANARTKLRILDVRPERLQEITEEEALAEGIWESELGWFWHEPRAEGGCITAAAAFMHLWNSIHKPPHDWDGNPFVWRIEFEKVGT